MSLSSSGTRDRANQILTDTLSTASAIAGFTYDHAGNMTTQPTGPISRRLFTWDAWNRLVKVEVQDRPSLSDPWNPARTRAVYTDYGRVASTFLAPSRATDIAPMSVSS